MFQHIMVPVDLTHAGQLEKALNVARDLARHYNARITYVGMTSVTPSGVAHNPEEYAAKLQAFAEAHADGAGSGIGSHAITLHDPAVELDRALVKASETLEADLVVVASHVPGARDLIWPSHGGRLAAHAKASVLVVRPD